MPHFRAPSPDQAAKAFQLMSLKTRTTLFALGLFFGAIWLSAWLATEDLRRNVRDILAAQQFVTVNYVANAINEAVRTRIESLEMIATAIRPEWLVDPSRAQAYLEERRAIYRLFDLGLFCVTADGVAIADYPRLPGRTGARFGDIEYVREVLRTGRPAIGRPRIGRFSGKPVILMAAPIKSAAGAVVGVLVGVNTITGGDVFSVVAPSALGGVGDVHVISPRDGLFVTSTDASRVLQSVPPPGVNAAHDRAMAGFEGSAVAVSSRGVEELGSAKGVPAAGWFVAGVIPTATAFQPIATMRSRVYVQAALLSLVVGGLFWLFVYREVAPLGRCAATLRRMTAGAASPDILPVEGCLEVRQLLEAFNRLTARILAQEDTLRQSEERYRSLVQCQSDIVARFDLAGRLTFVNDSACARIGLTREEMIGRHWNEFVHVEDLPAAMAEEARVASGATRQGIVEIRLLTVDGPRWYLSEGAAVRGAEGAVRELQVTCRDITERRRSEEGRLNQLMLLRALVEAIPAAVFYKDENGLYLGFNTRFAEFLGLPAERILGKTVADVADAETAEIYRRSDLRVLTTREPDSYNFTITAGDGAIRHMRTHKAPFEKADGSPGGIVGIILDISADVRHENELRTAREAADEASQAKSRFLAAMSHELRTPLNAILGFSEILRDPAYFPHLDDHCGEYLGYIHSSGRHLLDLINDILDISKIEAGSMQLDPTRVPTASALDGAGRLLRERAERNGLTLSLDVPPDIPDLWVDPRAVRQILFNLLSNAIKFTPRGGRVRLGARAEDGHVALVVTDTGSGIPVDQMDRVLKPFEQLDNRYTRARGGTGLGLSLVQGLVSLHGGRLDIDSAVGRGSTFTVRLPAAPAGPSVDLDEPTP